ncbi:RagB/SusD family nutrient uptake outer membrane protein [uncultured Bacteroides sp.]|uniref:RagB/SusD family nutrient uptake outer membrane protein n=1 Tax=uncultured Bacteroides sp. TaxID=162156 RepID=UPI0025FE5FF4|nr:RagB/SusD family nutrient uptake outer membrane protein [uncultured Bacteroides sp.]
MKKILFALLMVGALVTSCDMDKKPYGSLDNDTAIQNLNDCRRFRNGLYASMRSLTTGGYVNYPEIQMDIFQGVTTNGNRIGEFSNGNINSSTRDIATIWGNIYSIINSANFIINKMDEMLTNNEYTAEEHAELARYDGEAKFVRAYCYYWLADHYCSTYSASIAQSPGRGLPLVTVYNPTGDSSKYPGRSTQDETYKLISDDLTDAYNALLEYEKSDNEFVAPNAAYLSSYAVLALQARIALLKGDNATALSKAEEIIKSQIYKLAEISAYEAMWTKDEGTEAIFRPFMSSTELGSSLGGAYLSTKLDGADYIPTYDILNMYDEEDVRFDAFFTVWELAVDGNDVPAYVFKKYPGNESLKTTATPNYVNMPKMFRMGEIYLIAAEAAATTNQTLANKYLNELRSKRIADYEEINYADQILVQQIRSERLKELIGEGFRMSDLRRWGIGFQRNPDHPENPDINNILVPNGKELAYPAGDYRFVWPIPSAEMETNPQLAGQQNPGY